MVPFWQILLLAVFVVSCDSGHPSISVDKKFSRNFVQFEGFRRDFGKQYSSAKEALERFHIFAKNLEKIDQFNRMEEGTATYGINEMADWTEEEFLTRRANLNPVKLMESLESAKLVTFKDDDNQTVPETKDWRSDGKVSPVKNQGQCGSCWAFSSIAVVESMNAIKNNVTTPLSEQQLVDCDPKSQGCNGGFPQSALEYLVEYGSMTNASYPYTGKDGNCSYSANDTAANVTGVTTVRSGDEDALKKYVGLVSPTSNAVNANLLQFYRRGIIYPSLLFCPPLNQTLDHAVSVIGYGRQGGKRARAGTEYWIIKNSWGESWGEKGYARMQKGSNTCGIVNVVNGVNM